MNFRAVQGIFDDLNPETSSRWSYPDTGKWDPERNTREFVAAMPEWRRNGVLSFTLNLQGAKNDATQYGKNISTLQDRATNSFNTLKALKTVSDRAGVIATLADGTKSADQLEKEIWQLVASRFPSFAEKFKKRVKPDELRQNNPQSSLRNPQS